MAWNTGFPTTTGTDIYSYEFFIQLWRACRERYLASNSSYRFWPRQNVIHSSGTVASITSGTMTANAGHYDARPVGGDGKWNLNEWYNYNDGIHNYIPQYYDLIIDYNTFEEENKIVRADILAHPSGDTITISDITKYVTGNWISSLSDLEGKPFYIIKDGGLWWQDRWPQYPNDQELERGTQTSALHEYLTDTSKSWTTNEFQGKQLLTYADNGVLYRLSITGNNTNTVTFASGSRVSTGKYSIVESTTKADPNREPAYPYYWYGGAKETQPTHIPTDSITSTSMPTTNVDFTTGIGCGTSGHDAFDVDVWKEYDDGCENQTSDTCFSPNLYKTIRQLQIFLEGICYSFVEEKVYDGTGSIPTFVPATMFKKADVNWSQSTYTPTNNGIVTYNTSVPYSPIDIHWAILDDQGNTISYGSEVGSGTLDKTIDASYSGVSTTGIVSWGWTRYFPKEFRYMYDNTSFIPDDDGGPQMPEAVNGSGYPGTWTNRAKSTTYKDHTVYGFVTDSGSGFVNNDLVRYSGDNWNDPTLNGITADYQPYYDNFFEGKYSTSNQSTVDASMMGVATSGSHRHLIDNTKNWWTTYPQEGNLRTESGIATGGNTTSLSDTGKTGSTFWDTATGRWTGFILELTNTSGIKSGAKFPITSHTGTTLNFTAYNGISVDAGDTYSIREPKWTNNRWKNRTLRVTKHDNTTIDLNITHNDDTHIFFTPDSGFIVEEGLAYRIIENRPGGVWKYDSATTSWVVPTGTDTRTGGRPFKDDQNANLPTVTKRYGKMMKGDYVNKTLFEELYAVINTLVWTKTTGGWTSRYVATSGENNFRNSEWPEGIPGSAADPDWTTAKGEAETLFLDPSASGELDGLAPRAQSAGFRMDDYGDIYFASYYRNYAYLRVQNLNPILSKDIDYFSYGYIDSSDSTPSGSGPEYRAFDDNGDIVEYHKWKLFNSKSAGYSDTITSDKFGSISKPDDTPSPDIILTPPPYSSHSYTGYYVGDKCAIVKWNVTNGFKYYA